MEKRFKLHCVIMGSGWPSGHVAIDHYLKWPDKPGGNEFCLNYDTDTPAGLIQEIDDLIAELQELKSEVPAKFSQWQKLYDRKYGRGAG